jgi:hypothetical protein
MTSIQTVHHSKGAKFNIKTVKMYDSSTGYVQSFSAYTETKMELPSPLYKNKMAAMALNNTEPLPDGDHTSWMDNYFLSPNIVHFLGERKKRGTNCVGTLHANRRKSLLLSKQKHSTPPKKSWETFI